MENSINTTSTNRSPLSGGNVGEDSLHSIMVSNSTTLVQSCYDVPLFESADQLPYNNQNMSNSSSEHEIDCGILSTEICRVESDNEYNLVHAEQQQQQQQQQSIDNKKDDNDYEDDDEDDHWKVISSQQAECPIIHTISLNQDKSCLSICTDQGYKIRQLPHSNNNGLEDDEYQQNNQPVMIHTSKYSNQSSGSGGGVSLCQMLYCTSLLAIVTINSPRTLSLLNAKTDTVLCQFNFTFSIINVELNRKIMLVLTSDGTLSSFDLSTSALKLVASDTILNSKLFIRSCSSSSSSFTNTRFTYYDLSQHEEDIMSYYCITTSSNENEEAGHVIVRNAYNLKIINKVQAFNNDHAHNNNSKVSKMIIGGLAHCQLFATTNTKGMYIYIYSLPSCEKKYNLYRGSNACVIYSMCFTNSANCIAISGSSGTIHIYNLNTASDDNASSSSYLPATTQIVTTKIWNLARSFRSTPKLHASSSTTTSSTAEINTGTNEQQQQYQLPLIKSFLKIKLKLEYNDINIISIFPINNKSTEQQQEQSQKNEYIILVITMDGKMLHYLINDNSSSSASSSNAKLINADELLFDSV